MKTAKIGYANWRAELLNKANIQFTIESKQLKTMVTEFIVVKSDMNSRQLIDKVFELLRAERVNNPDFINY